VAAQTLAKPGASARAALAPALAAVLTNGDLVPAGTQLTLGSDAWHQQASFAQTYGTLRLNNGPVEHVAVGYVKVKARWLITYVEPRR
jgi:hypothetical protein